MSGILNNKSRIIDAILTYEGRRQMAENTFTVKYASFSDSHVVYSRDDLEGHDDPTKRFYLEAFNSPQDQIVFEADDSGNLVPFRQHSSIKSTATDGSESWTSFVNGKIKSKTQIFSSSNGSFSDSLFFGPKFASEVQGILQSSVENFNQLKIIGSFDDFFEDKDFVVSPNEIEFKILSDSETLQMVPPTNVNTVDSLFNDEKLRNVINFKYLPPIKKTNLDIDKSNMEQIKGFNLLIGDYPPFGPIEELKYSNLKQELKKYESSSKTITFDPTSRDNDIIAQFFEITNSEVKKLDVIDYGRVNDTSLNSNSTSHIFFVGKVVTDDNGSNCFIHLFTLVFESK